MPKNYCIMQIWAESGKSALPICNYSQILYQFLAFTQNLKRSHNELKKGIQMQNLMPSVKFYILCIRHSIQNFPRVVDAISYYVDLYKLKPQKLPIVKSILPLYSWASPSFVTRGQDRNASVFPVQ